MYDFKARFCLTYPYLFKYRWASEHKDHKIVLQIANPKSSSAEWGYYGSTLIDDIYDWKKISKTGTGFTKKPTQ